MGDPCKHRTAGILCLANSGRESQARTGAGTHSRRQTDNTFAACGGIRTGARSSACACACVCALTSARTRRRTLAQACGNCTTAARTATATRDPAGSKSCTSTRTRSTAPASTSARHRTTCRSHTTQSTRSNTQATTPARIAIRCAQSAGLPARWCAAHLPQVSRPDICWEAAPHGVGHRRHPYRH